MNLLRTFAPVALSVLLMARGAKADGDPAAVAKVMEMMPASFSTSVVVVNPEALDQTISVVAKRFDPGYSGDAFLAPIKESLGSIGDWIDFSKPMGMAGPGFFSGRSTPVVWAHIADFATKVRTLQNVTEEEGVWHVGAKTSGDAKGDAAGKAAGGAAELYVRVSGDYIVAAPTKALLAEAGKEGKSFAAAVKPRLHLLQRRDALLHVNFEVVRPMILGGLAQAAQMVPMMAMMAGQQGGADPAAMTGVFTAMIDSAKQFAEQVESVDITFALSDKTADVTIATSYNEGPIKSYLAKQKPAGIPFFTEVEARPYFVAFGAHLPGSESPFVDFMVDRMLSGMQSAAPGAAPGAAASGTPKQSQAEQTQAMARLMRELYRKIEGVNMIMAMSSDGMTMLGDYLTSDGPGVVRLIKESVSDTNPFLQQFKGIAYESLGPWKIGDVAVERFALKVDSSSPQAAMLGNLYGKNPRFALGVAGGRVRFCLGGDQEMTQAFAGTVSHPLAATTYVTAAMRALPRKRNAVVLVDPAAFLAGFGPMFGLPKTGPVPPGPPVAISASITGEPARLDIHVPLRAIERVIQLLGPEQPL